jgi:hypothetical protein
VWYQQFTVQQGCDDRKVDGKGSLYGCLFFFARTSSTFLYPSGVNCPEGARGVGNETPARRSRAHDFDLSFVKSRLQSPENLKISKYGLDDEFADKCKN